MDNIFNIDGGDPLWVENSNASMIAQNSAFPEEAPSVTGQISVWLGSWIKKPVKVWNGTTWAIKPVKFWNGSSWVATT